MLFADKTGCNTKKKKDGHIAGTKYITKRGTPAQQMSFTPERRFTVPPFLVANGKSVCCMVIFQSKQDSPNFKWAHDITKEPVRNKSVTWIS